MGQDLWTDISLPRNRSLRAITSILCHRCILCTSADARGGHHILPVVFDWPSHTVLLLQKLIELYIIVSYHAFVLPSESLVNDPMTLLTQKHSIVSKVRVRRARARPPPVWVWLLSIQLHHSISLDYYFDLHSAIILYCTVQPECPPLPVDLTRVTIPIALHLCY